MENKNSKIPPAYERTKKVYELLCDCDERQLPMPSARILAKAVGVSHPTICKELVLLDAFGCIKIYRDPTSKVIRGYVLL